jgi:hypothetical protein
VTDEDPAVDIEAAIETAIADVMAQHDASMVTKWVALVEVIDGEGRSLWTLTSDDVKAWDTVGLLQHGLHLQLAQTVSGEAE